MTGRLPPPVAVNEASGGTVDARDSRCDSLAFQDAWPIMEIIKVDDFQTSTRLASQLLKEIFSRLERSSPMAPISSPCSRKVPTSVFHCRATTLPGTGARMVSSATCNSTSSNCCWRPFDSASASSSFDESFVQRAERSYCKHSVHLASHFSDGFVRE